MIWLDRLREGDRAELRCNGEVCIVSRVHRAEGYGVDGVEFEGDPRIWRPFEICKAEED